MLEQFLNFVITVFKSLIDILHYTEIGGIPFDTIIVTIFIFGIVVRTLMIRFK